MIELSPNPTLLAAPDGTPYDRLGGWENELGYSGKPKLVAATIPLPADFAWSIELQRNVTPEVLLARLRGDYYLFEDDAYRRYIDVGHHPESSTPEHLDYLDLAYSSLHGILKMSRILGESAEEMRQRGLDPGMVITANNSDPLGNVWATHHNLIARRGLERRNYEDALLTHYVSRIVWAGSGAPIQNQLGRYQLGLSARADHIYEEVSSATTRSRPLINTRDVPYADGKVFRRLHGINGEMVFSPQVLAAVMATESILLRACELGVKFDDLRPENPVEAIQQVSHDPSLQQEIIIKGPKEGQPRSITAIQLQRELINRALDAADKADYLTEQERHYGKIVNHYLDLLEHKDQKRSECKELFDWVIKEEMFANYLARPRKGSMTDFEAAWAAMVAFHRTYPREGFGMKLLRGDSYIKSPSEEILDNGPGLPPTRAKLRAEAMRLLGRHGLAVEAGWQKFAVYQLVENKDDILIGSVILNDPYAIQSDELEKLTRQALARAA